MVHQPFHAGELAVQQRVGVAEEAQAVGRGVYPKLIGPVARFLATQRVAVAASVDAGDRPWASLLTGPPGFLTAVDDELLRIAVTPDEADPLAANLGRRPEVGLLVVNLETRQRMRINGRGLIAPDGVWLSAQQVYGNCPKYIQPRRIVAEHEPTGGPVQRAARLDDRQVEWIRRSDTFFIASFDGHGGADASHRGGRPRFVRVIDDARLLFPDYPGNNMFNTLGNLAAHPRAGLLFVDFASGGLLQLTGRTRIRFDPQREVLYDVEEVVERTRATSLRWDKSVRSEEE